MSVLLKASDLTVGHSAPLLSGIQLCVERGQTWALLGLNGAGKTTLMRTLLGFLPSLGGSVDRRASKLAYIAQRTSVDLTVPSRVVDLVQTGCDRGLGFLRIGGRKTRARSALSQMRALALAPSQFAELSEGQKQRVLLARALASEPDLLFLDEPTSAMDAESIAFFYALLAEQSKERDLGIVLISHDIGEALRVADHICFVDHDSHKVFAGPHDVISQCAPFTRTFGVAHA